MYLCHYENTPARSVCHSVPRHGMEWPSNWQESRGGDMGGTEGGGVCHHFLRNIRSDVIAKHSVVEGAGITYGGGVPTTFG